MRIDQIRTAAEEFFGLDIVHCYLDRERVVLIHTGAQPSAVAVRAFARQHVSVDIEASMLSVAELAELGYARRPRAQESSVKTRVFGAQLIGVFSASVVGWVLMLALLGRFLLS